MPLVEINMLKGKSYEYKQYVLESIHAALERCFGIPEWDKFQRINEYDRENFQMAPSKSDDFMIINITIKPGRTKAQKAKAIEVITEYLYDELGVKAEDVFIVFIEPPYENWGFAGVQLKDEKESDK